MNINKKSSFSTIKKLDKNNKINYLIKYKTDRNSIEKAYLKYPIKSKLKQKKNLLDTFNLKSNTKEKTLNKKSNFKSTHSYKDILKNAYKKLNKDLRQYNYNQNKYNIQKSNEIIFAKNKRIVSIFKDNLLWNETSDFLKQFYKTSESKNLIPSICEYYECFSLLFPEYGPLEDVLKTMKKFMKKKKIYFEKYEDNDEKSTLNRNYVNNENTSSKNKVNVKSDKFKFQKIIDEKDINIDISKTSKTYSHSKTCLNYNNEIDYFKEKEIDNLKNLSTIVLDFFNNDEKKIDNYKYFSKTKNDNEEKKIEKYFQNKEKNALVKKDKKEKNKIELKIKKSDNIAIQKFKLKNIFKIIKFSNKFKKINIKNLNENLIKNKILYRNEYNLNRLIKKSIKNINSKNNSKKVNIINNNLIKKNINKPIYTNSHNSNKKTNNKFKKYNNYSSSIGKGKKKLLLLSKSKESNSNNASKSKTGHRYQLLIDKIFNNSSIPKNQKYSINKSHNPRNHSDGPKNIRKKPINLKSKDKQIKEKNDKRKKIFLNNNNLNNYASLYNNNISNYNNILSLTSINKTLTDKVNTLNIKKMNIKKINNCKKTTNPFIIKNNVIKYKHSSFENNNIKNKKINEYILLSLSNRIHSNKKEKIRLNFILNKTNDTNTNNSDLLNNNLKTLNSKKIKNQSCIRPVNHINNKIILKKNNKKEKYKLNTYTKDSLKEYTDSHISMNDEIFKDKKGNNTIKLISIINPENKIIKKMKFNCNKKGGNTSRSKNKNRNRNKKDLKEFNICDLKKNEIFNIKNKKLNSIEKDRIKDNTFKSLLINFKKIK